MPGPANGRYRLTQTAPPPAPGIGPWDVRVADGVLHCFPFRYERIPGTGMFTLAPGIGIVFNDDGTWDATAPGGQAVHGTYTWLGP